MPQSHGGGRGASRDAAVAPGSTINVTSCDLASFAGVRACARELRSRFGEIALLINNAGIVSGLRRLSPNGFELTFATNHLGPFLLTNLLIDRMAAHGRIINVASRVHFRARFDLGHVALQEALWLASERWTRAGAETRKAEVAAALPSGMGSA